MNSATQSTRPADPACFIAHADGTFTCEACWTPEQRESTGDDEVEVWREGTSGWLAPLACASCNRDIPVLVDGKDNEGGGGQ